MNSPLEAAADLLQILSHGGDLSDTARSGVSTFMRAWSVSAFDALLESHVFSEQVLAEILARNLRLPTMAHLAAEDICVESLRDWSYDQAKTYCCLPVVNKLVQGSHKKLIAVSDPSRPMLAGALTQAFGVDYAVVLVPQCEVVRAIDEYYPLALQLSMLGRKQ